MLGIRRVSAIGPTLLACHSSLYRYARALSRDPIEAEELVQETYRRALSARRCPETVTLENVRPWVFTILRNAWHNANRKHRREASEQPLSEAIPARGEDSPDIRLSRQLLRSEIAQAIDALPDVLREIILLREIESLSYAEIASVVGCPPGTVMSRLSRARQELRRQLAKFAPSPDEVRK
jgi:RNA polymerase sigma-70 factor (ECF subfamily)